MIPFYELLQACQLEFLVPGIKSVAWDTECILSYSGFPTGDLSSENEPDLFPVDKAVESHRCGDTAGSCLALIGRPRWSAIYDILS